jgi:hypothetical protein
MKNKIHKCRICSRPMLLSTWDTTSKEKNFDKQFKPFQDPSTHPNVEKWCGGECDSAVIPFILLVSDAEELLPTAETKREKSLIKWYNRHLLKAVKNLKKTLEKRDSLK